MAELSDVLIHRAAPADNFTVIRNEIFNCPGLSIEALGLLTYLISKPADWTVSHAQLRKQFGIGRDKLMRVIKELEGFGFVVRRQQRDPDTQSFGKIEFHVYDQQMADQAAAEPVSGGTGMVEEEAVEEGEIEDIKAVEEPCPEKPLTGKPYTAEPSTANPHLQRIDIKKNNNITKSPQPPNGRRRQRKRKVETPLPPDRQQVFVEQWSPQWKAWSATRSKPWPTTDYRDPGTGRYRTGWWFPSEWPQGHEGAERSQGCREGQRG